MNKSLKLTKSSLIKLLNNNKIPLTKNLKQYKTTMNK